MANLVSQAQYARMRGVSKQALNKLVQAGKIPLVDGKIDVDYADLKLRENVDPARSKAAASLGDRPLAAPASASARAQPPQQNSSLFFESRAEREHVELQRAQLALRRELEQVLEREPTERAVFEAARMLRDQLMNVSMRLAPDLAAISDADEIDRRLSAELRRALGEFVKLAQAAVDVSSN